MLLGHCPFRQDQRSQKYLGYDLGRFNGAIVLLTEYIPSTKKVLVSSFEIIYLMEDMIGDPIPYKDYLAGNLNLNSTNVIDQTKVHKYHDTQTKSSQKTAQQVAQTPSKSDVNK